MKKDWYITFKEKGVTYMQCKSCNNYVSNVSEDAIAITCGTCNAIKIPWPKTIKQYKPTGRPAGWHWMAEFVDKDGTVYHKGKEQPELKGTLKPTKVKPPKKKKKLTADEKLFKKAADWKKRKKARRGK